MAPATSKITAKPFSGYFKEFLEREYGTYISRPPIAKPTAGDEPDSASPVSTGLTLSTPSEELS